KAGLRFLCSAFCILTSAFFIAGCRQEMADQPRCNPLAPSDFFPDGRSARDPVPGTVPHTAGEAGGAAYEAATPNPARIAEDVALAAGGGLTPGVLLALDTKSAYRFPAEVKVNDDLLKRGQERFNIYCSVCHDRVGTGNGRIVQRGYLHPPSYHIPRLREAALTYLYEVVSDGHGAMPSYSDKLPPQDRWAVIAYIRALQLSQDATAADLSAAEPAKPQPGGANR
ncbi:MAG TPA: cytochrome c, partial [Gemmataceae bacterium]|nr:cytochrome c [Gemmataceae bacterium]